MIPTIPPEYDLINIDLPCIAKFFLFHEIIHCKTNPVRTSRPHFRSGIHFIADQPHTSGSGDAGRGAGGSDGATQTTGKRGS